MRNKIIEEFENMWTEISSKVILDIRDEELKFIFKKCAEEREAGYKEGYGKGVKDGKEYQYMTDRIENSKVH